MAKNDCEYCLIFWTCRNVEEAKRVISGLLDEKLIACGSILPEVISMYVWEGKREEGKEAKVILKTVKAKYEGVEAYIKEKGSYAVPEILQVAVERGNGEYLEWVDKINDGNDITI